MTDSGRRSETKTVQAFRGKEPRTIAKWEQQGWHLVTQAPGDLRTGLTFQRERPPVPMKALVGGAVTLVALAVLITIGVITERSGEGLTTDGSAAGVSTAPAQDGPHSSAPATPTSAASDPVEVNALTVQNNRDFAALLKKPDNCDDSMARFAHKYQDRTVSFDGAVAAIGPHRSAETRYDILIVPGEADATVGPSFQYADVNTTDDLGWTGKGVVDSLAVGMKLRVAARVNDFDPNTCLFHLDPVTTSVR